MTFWAQKFIWKLIEHLVILASFLLVFFWLKCALANDSVETKIFLRTRRLFHRNFPQNHVSCFTVQNIANQPNLKSFISLFFQLSSSGIFYMFYFFRLYTYLGGYLIYYFSFRSLKWICIFRYRRMYWGDWQLSCRS